MKASFILPTLLTFVTFGFGQQPATATYDADQQLQAWRRSRASTLMDDFGELYRYRKANAALPAPATGEKRVVFFGDSITDFWDLEKHFPGRQYINRGISGQTTSQMLLRFRQDVVDLRPRAVVILAGTNDIAGNTGPISIEAIEGNFASMAEIAEANGIRVIISSVLPVHNYTPKSDLYFPLRPMPQILKLNRWLKQYCASHRHTYLDYFAVMLDGQGFLKREYANDGLHPTETAYSAMSRMAEDSIQASTGGKASKKRKPGN